MHFFELHDILTSQGTTKTQIKGEYDYEALMTEFSTIAGDLMNKNQTKYGPLITQIIDRILGRGKKISDTTPDQAEFVYLILQEVKEIQ